MTLSIHDLLFNLFSLLTIACAFTVVTTPSPIHSALFLVGTFTSAGCLLILFGAEYLGITFIIVYVGAIVIVFLFVIMMLNIKQAELKESLRSRLSRYLPAGGILSFISLSFILIALRSTSSNYVGHPYEGYSMLAQSQDHPYLS
jgi:NADH:ubiquinone oxidoreductase subunit 6 (subunit J)